VTGGAGFIGSHLVSALLGAGAEVVVLDDFSNGGWDNLSNPSVAKGLVVKKGDVRDRAAVTRALDGVETVFHLAASASVQAGSRDPASMMSVNLDGTKVVLECSLGSSVERFLFASSAAIYGNASPPLNESLPSAPISTYGRSKLAGEELCLRALRESGLKTIVLRYFNVYGPRQRSSTEAGVVTKFAVSLSRGEGPTVYGTGEQTRDFVHVKDVVEANVVASGHPAAEGKVYNVGTGIPTSVNELLRIESALFQVPERLKVKYEGPREGDIQESFAEVGLISRDLGFSPKVGLEEGLRGYVKWYLGQGRSRKSG
jgi:UDP-glucose 4-epimerase